MQNSHVTRRNFVKLAGLAGAASALGAVRTFAQTTNATGAEESRVTVGTRTFGKTGVKVSMLSLGGIFDIASNQLVLQRALDFGVTYWDTANSYTNGNSEKGIGMYFEKHPEVRRKIFLVTKAGGGHAVENVQGKLEESLRRLKTDYVDLFFLHGVGSGDAFTPEIKAWAEKMKAEKKIRFFGFSTHGNMERTLEAAAKLGWIDGIMLKYDYRLMQTDAMRSAMDACEKAGIGLTAMKTQGGGPIKTETDADLKLGGHFVKRGFSEHQARLKAVWENPQVAAICSQMPNITVLTANVAAALDKTRLTAADHSALREYAAATCSHYCDGCAHLCEGALRRRVPVADVMRSLMYHHTYGDMRLAKETFAGLPVGTRDRIATLDFSNAERACPNRLPIGQLMKQAGELLA
ncbi:MAG TPA: aldo/keto reductase [Verrucomicrobiae bacterium]|nr:aldo/keto reductase [Verrucomicrobiae bacterium]